MEFSIATINNITAVIIMAGLFISVIKGKDYVYKDVKAICVLAGLTVCESIFELVIHVITGNTSFIWLNYFSNTMLFVINVMIGITWVVFVHIKAGGSQNLINKKEIALASIPGIIIIILTIANLFTPVFYTISPDNVYSRTEWYVCSVLVAIFYMGYGFVVFFIKSRKNQRYTFYPVVAFLLPVLIYQIYQMFFENMSLTSLGVSIGIISLYLCYKNEAACIDYLSGIFNRQYFERFLKDAIRTKHKNNKMLAGVMLDIDSFKYINDNYGHLVGNDAICEAAQILIKINAYFDTKVYAFRYGGDEFALLQWVEGKDEVEAIIQKMNELSESFNNSGIRPYKIKFSHGYAFYYAMNDTIESFVARMDEEMYRNKQAKKKLKA